MEWFQNGVISAADTGGIELTWGNEAAVHEMLRRIAYREGFGDVLAEGSIRAAGTIGERAEKSLVLLKGMPILGRDPRVGSLAKALGARLEIRLVPEEEDAHVDHQSNTLELPTNIAADQFATSIASKKQLLAAGRASLESQTPTLLCDGVEIGLASSGEPTPSFTEEAVPMPNWPVRGGIRWIDHAPEEPEAKEALR